MGTISIQCVKRKITSGFNINSLSIIHRLRGEGQTPGSLSTWTATIGTDEVAGTAQLATADAWNGKGIVTTTSGFLSESTSAYLNNASAFTIAAVYRSTISTNSLWYRRTALNIILQSYLGNHYFTVGSGVYSYTASISTNDCIDRVIWVYDGSLSGNTNRLKCYINGVAQTLSFSGSIPAALPSMANGSKLFDTTYYPNGDISDLIISDQALDSTTITNLDKYLADTYMPDLVFGGGDSITYGYPTGLSASWTTQLRNSSDGLVAGRDVRNCSTTGWKIADLASASTTQVFPFGAAYHRKKIFISAIGTNNIGSTSQSVASALVELDAYFANLISAGFSIVATTMLPRQDTTALTANGTQAAVNAKIAEWNAALYDRVGTTVLAVCDLTTVPELTDPTNTLYFQADLAHLTTLGETKFYLKVAETLNSI
jgi:hypothetical protein